MENFGHDEYDDDGDENDNHDDGDDDENDVRESSHTVKACTYSNHEEFQHIQSRFE